jgi:hypothetical protein
VRPGFIIEEGAGWSGLRLCFATLVVFAFAEKTAGAAAYLSEK